MAEPPLLSPRARQLLLERGNDIVLSAASGWEISIKRKLGRIELPLATASFIADALSAHAITVLPITMAHAIRAGDLPLHHKDPFDRLIIAQADIENIPVATPDRNFSAYPIEAVW